MRELFIWEIFNININAMIAARLEILEDLMLILFHLLRFYNPPRPVFNFLFF